ncbi:LlaJI family restriction endonuclease [Fibrobacter sp. UWB11]|uniref:LlaJI family restriction endonuclease n=1 Tax=Fibrobacter sp. UWB11 TaxID=1896202 RepID=UPI0009288A36|nr:LlaJI family restriction endonuclease [Fibrobacter sp. UWB11]SIO28090.1 LlaJI restriction endonuclease [Fibrobacter sp. UWB11]
MQKLNEICSCESKANSETEFVGIRCEKSKEDGALETSIIFPLGYFKDDSALRELPEDELRECVVNLFTVLSDPSLQEQIHQNSSISTFAEEHGESEFPMVSYLNVIRNFLDFGYLDEKEILYKKGANGKISWGRTIKAVRPVITENEQNLVYLDFVARKVSYNEDTLITQVHKFCVHDALVKLGFLFGIDPSEEPQLDFDYDLFCNAIHSKLAKTFNDRDLRLLADLARIVEYLAGHKTEDGKTANEFYFGVNKFAPVWEAMVDKIFGKLPQGVTKDKFNPHLKFVVEGSRNGDGFNYQDEDNKDENHRSTLRPDTIMVMGEGVYILDSKYYKYGLTGFNSHLPGAESVCKQMAYAEYVETHWKEILGANGDSSNATHSQNDALPKPIYNAFIMPYCADAEKWDEIAAVAELPRNDVYAMKRAGYIYGDWKDRSKPYHKIHCILLDMKSVMRNYANNPAAQDELAELIKNS